MKFLVTNDDSIESPFIHELIRALTEAGHDLVIAAPRTEQSWIGAAKSRSRAVEAKQVDYGFKCPTWRIDGTPSDCVNIALDHLVPQGWVPDGVLSGINIGFNASLGFILASGTVSGAFEGALHGVPAIAFSQDMSTAQFERLRLGGKPEGDLLKTLHASAARAARFASEFAASTPRNRFIVHNVNFPLPCTADTPVKRTVPARVIVPRLFSPRAEDGTHHMIFRYGDDLSPDSPLTDRAALSADCISHSILDYTRLGVKPEEANPFGEKN